ncbi:glycosyltransferase family 4 protein [Nonomuraea fuscirosea]|uniref:glycosyltransferase family 4 protein n=1 Tax=Nonomuraea fuscirosea TaxID=1291556 RepID=UPI003715491D
MTVIESTVVTKPTYRVVVALRDGFYGASSGSGFSNRDFLVALTRLLPPGCLVVMPVQGPSDTVDPCWADRLLRSLRQAEAQIVPINDSSEDPSHVRRRIVETVAHLATGTERCLLISLSRSLLSLGDHAIDNVDLMLVPRTTAALSCPDDVSEISRERDCLHTAVKQGGRVAAISVFMRQHLRDDYGLPADGLVDLPNGLLLGEEPPEEEALPLPGPAERGFLFALGRPVPEKGFEDLLAALDVLRSRRVPVPHLVLAATTPDVPNGYQRRLAKVIEDGGADATLITGFDPRIRAWMSSPALLGIIVPSRVEPFGRIPLEAFAAEAGPVIAPRVGGLRETIVDGFTGFTAEPHDPALLADAIHCALTISSRDRCRFMETGVALLRRRHDYLRTIRTTLAEVSPWALRPTVRSGTR